MAMTPMMDIYAAPGTKVVFAYPTHGFQGDRAHAARHLKVGETYTVKCTSVGESNSSVYLQEFPNTCFNTVQFAPAEPRGDENMATLAARMNGDTVKALQSEVRKLRRALTRIALGRIGAKHGVRAAFEYERIAREALSK